MQERNSLSMLSCSSVLHHIHNQYIQSIYSLVGAATDYKFTTHHSAVPLDQPGLTAPAKEHSKK